MISQGGKVAMSETFETPRLIGRTVRLLLGIYILYGLIFGILPAFPEFLNVGFPMDPNVYIGLIVSFYFLNDVVNGGLNRHWGRWPQLVALLVTGLAVALSLSFYGAVWGPPLGLVMFPFTVFMYGYIGTAFVLATILATPGCETSSFRHLISRFRGRELEAAACSALLERMDAWEAQRQS